MKHFLGLALLLLAAPARSSVEPPLDQAALRGHIAYLADDALQGRKPGTEGGDLAVRYIVEQFQDAGLQPGARDGSWYQPVGLIERKPLAADQIWYARGQRLRLDPGAIQLTARAAVLRLRKAAVIFAGYGLDIPDKGFADLQGVDVRNKVVLIMSGRPDAAPDAPGLEVRRAAISRAGAAAVIALTGSQEPWDLIREQLGRGRTVLADEDHAPLEGALAFRAWVDILGASGENPRALVAAASEPGFRARPLKLRLDVNAKSAIRRFDSPNVIGRLGGTRHPDEAIFYLAHWDHLGLCRPEGVADRICNGAIDNASGIALLIEVARRLARGAPPDRSIYFVATTAEEIGLLGARVLTRDPPVARDKIVAAINFDTVAIAPAGTPVAIIGRGKTPLDPIIDSATRAQGPHRGFR